MRPPSVPRAAATRRAAGTQADVDADWAPGRRAHSIAGARGRATGRTASIAERPARATATVVSASAGGGPARAASVRTDIGADGSGADAAAPADADKEEEMAGDDDASASARGRQRPRGAATAPGRIGAEPVCSVDNAALTPRRPDHGYER